MRHVNYERWADYLNTLFSRADLEVINVLDVSCGTGSLLLQLNRRQPRLQLAGFDESFNMVQMARRKLYNANLSFPIWCGSMRRFACTRSFEAAVSTYDSLNYCLTSADVQSVFSDVAELLQSGGLFVFDICTEKNSKHNFVNYMERDGADEYEYVRQAYYLRNKRMQVNEFTIEWHRRGRDRVYHEVHQQRIYRIDEIKEMIPRQKFEIVGIYDGFSFRAGTENSDRVQFVLKRC